MRSSEFLLPFAISAGIHIGLLVPGISSENGHTKHEDVPARVVLNIIQPDLAAAPDARDHETASVPSLPSQASLPAPRPEASRNRPSPKPEPTPSAGDSVPLPGPRESLPAPRPEGPPASAPAPSAGEPVPLPRARESLPAPGPLSSPTPDDPPGRGAVGGAADGNGGAGGIAGPAKMAPSGPGRLRQPIRPPVPRAAPQPVTPPAPPPPEPAREGNGDTAAESSDGNGGAVGAQVVGVSKPQYPGLSRRQGEEGRVVLSVEITAAGNRGAIEIATSSGHPRLDQAAIKALSRAKFIPARRDGKPVTSTKRVAFTFRLEDE